MSKDSKNSRENFSIVFKLNTWHLSQVFLSFLWINIIIICLFAGGLLYSAELYIVDRAEDIPLEERLINDDPDGLKLPGFIDYLLPEHSKGAVRQLKFNHIMNVSFWEGLSDVQYRVWVPMENGSAYYAIDYHLGEGLSIFLKLMPVLLVFELIFFINSIGKGARAVRQGLQPLYDLARTAKNINKIKVVQPDDQLRDLTGAIDTINIARLDRRISVNPEQKELRELASAINGMLDRIDAAYRSQVRFVSDASHELRTPISVIQGYANLLDRWGKNDEKVLQESIDAIKGEADSMKNMVEQLLFLARGDNDSMKLNMETVDISRIADEVVKETSMIDPNHNFITKISVNVYTIGDSQLIKQAIRIFVDNSVKYTPIGETIAVSTLNDGEFAKIIVQDNGIGILPEDLPHIFDRFYRSDDSRARKTGGTGLGLSIAKWIIDRHDATVDVLSRKDIGTRVTVSFKLYGIS